MLPASGCRRGRPEAGDRHGVGSPVSVGWSVVGPAGVVGTSVTGSSGVVVGSSGSIGGVLVGASVAGDDGGSVGSEVSGGEVGASSDAVGVGSGAGSSVASGLSMGVSGCLFGFVPTTVISRGDLVGSGFLVAGAVGLVRGFSACRGAGRSTSPFHEATKTPPMKASSTRVATIGMRSGLRPAGTKCTCGSGSSTNRGRSGSGAVPVTLGIGWVGVSSGSK